MPEQVTQLNREYAIDVWRAKLHQAQEQYQSAASFYRKVLAQPPGSGDTQMMLIRLAHQAETRALAEFRRVLGIFSDLTLNDKMPDNQPDPTVWSRFISVVDDDESVRDSTMALLRSAGYVVRTFESAERFLESGAVDGTGCLILDVRMTGMDGLELQRRLGVGSRRIPVIFVTSHDDAAVQRRAIEGGAVEFFCKPYNPSALMAAVEAALRASENGDGSGR